MCKFIQIIYNPRLTLFQNLHYIPHIKNCYERYSKYLHDDFASNSFNLYIEETSPYIWAILDYNDQFMGFVSLDNFIGDNTHKYSAEILTCFERKAWGKFTRYSAKFFLKKCFDELGLYKIKALVYPDNFRISSLLKHAGFKYETTLPAETVRFGKLQDIKQFAIYRTYYYNEVKDGNKR